MCEFFAQKRELKAGKIRIRVDSELNNDLDQHFIVSSRPDYTRILDKSTRPRLDPAY